MTWILRASWSRSEGQHAVANPKVCVCVCVCVQARWDRRGRVSEWTVVMIERIAMLVPNNAVPSLFTMWEMNKAACGEILKRLVFEIPQP